MNRRIQYRFLIFILSMAVVNTACTAVNETAKPTETTVTPLEELLKVFITTPDASIWDKLKDVKSVEWDSEEPRQYVPPREKTRKRQSMDGYILLQGFSIVDIPNGKAGLEAAFIKGNEGRSKISVYSDIMNEPSNAGAAGIRVVKNYPTNNHQKILQHQLSNHFKISLFTDKCSHGKDTEVTFYQVSFAGFSPIFVKVFLDFEGGKYTFGETYIYFYREKPLEMLNHYQCVFN